MRTKLSIAILIATLILPTVSGQAYQEEWNINSFPEGANTRTLHAVHSYNPGDKRMSDPFWVSASAWSNASVTSVPAETFRFRLDDAVGSTTAIDSGPSGMHGTVLGNPTFGVEGHINTALLFDGDNDHVTVPDSAALDATTFSAGGWFYLDATQPTSGPRLMDKVNAIGTSGWRLYFLRDSNSFQFDTCNVTCGGGSTTSLFPEGNLYNVWVTYNGATNAALIYVNGVQRASFTPAVDPAANTDPLHFGINIGLGSDYDGWMDHLQFFGSVLTANQIRFLAESDRPTYPWLTEITPTGCTVTDSQESYGGQYQFSRAWLLTPTDTTCTWVGQIQYYDPGVAQNPAVNLFFTGAVIVRNDTATPTTSANMFSSLPGFTDTETAGFLILLIAMIWAMWNDKWFTAVTTLMGVLWTLTEVYGSTSFDEHIFLVGIAFFILGLWIESIAGGFRARKAAKENPYP